MVPPAKLIADGGEGCRGVFPAKIHGHLSGEGDIPGPSLGFQISYLNVEVIADGLLDVFYGQFSVGAAQGVLEHLFSQVYGDRRLSQRAECP